jgi:RNA polymerase sigma-70 factor (ECF subfamily)
VAADAAASVARENYGKLLAFLCARTGDVAAAEDALAVAFEAALNTWPVNGVPEQPQAWLFTVAKRELVDNWRHRAICDAATADLLLLADVSTEDLEERQRATPDDRLTLMFACAHPAIDSAMRAPLMLQTILGLDAGAIASAFLLGPATMGQRLSRAKAKIKRAGIPFCLPAPETLSERLDSVLQAIYTAFTLGWTDPAGVDARRQDLAEESLWLGQLLAAMMPDQAEVLGLYAMMLYAHSRRRARRSESGEFIPLAAQDVQRWDHGMIDTAETVLRAACKMDSFGRFQLEAAVQSAHSFRRISGRVDWQAVARLYEALARLTDSPVVQINRAVAMAELNGAEAGLRELNQVAGDLRLATYQPYWAARAQLLADCGHTKEADAAYGQAMGLEIDPAVRRFLQARREALNHQTTKQSM